MKKHTFFTILTLIAACISPFMQASEPPVAQTKIIPTLQEIAAAKIAQQIHDNQVSFEHDESMSLDQQKKAVRNALPFNQKNFRMLLAKQYRRLYPEEFTSQMHSLDNAHTLGVSSIVFSSDGNLMASASADTFRTPPGDATIKIWSKQGNQFKLLQTLDRGVSACALAFSPDDKYLAVASRGFQGSIMTRELTMWARQNDDTFELFQLRNPVNTIESIAFSPDGMLMARGFPDSKVEIHSKNQQNQFEFKQGFSADNVPGYSASATVTFTPSGELIIAGRTIGIKIWSQNEQHTFVERQHIPNEIIENTITGNPYTDSVTGHVACAPSNDYFVYSSDNFVNICTRQADNTFVRTRIPGMRGKHLTFKADGLLAVSNGASGEMWARKADDTFERLHTLTVPDGYPFTHINGTSLVRGHVSSIALSPNGDYCAVGTNNGILGQGSIKIWNNIKKPITDEQFNEQLFDELVQRALETADMPGEDDDGMHLD